VSLQVIVKRPYTKAENLTRSSEVKGRQYPIAGTWVDNLAAQGKMVMLCSLCKSKFNPKRYHYIQWSKTWLAVANCDGCSQLDRNIYSYIPEAMYDDISPDRGRRKGRWALAL
jgi:hypothetical protein